MWSRSLRFPHQNLVCTSPLSVCATCPAHLSLRQGKIIIKFA
jgi:hypothetical protein